MGSLSQAKTMGGIGSILVLLGIVPLAGPALEIFGFVLMLVAIKSISDALNNKSVFNNAIISVVAAIAGIVAGIVVGVVGMLSFFGPGMFQGNMMPGRFQPSDFMSMNFLGPIIAGLVIIWIAFIVSGVFLKKSFDSIASGLNVKMFGTAALLYLIGAVLTIVLVGFLVIFVAAILQVVAFFSIPENPPQAAPTAQ
ncbi:MAG: DUF996 domain-containing protein [Thaumarchaeota archaeon]|nr:DUF996 domain-containing protein [Nitrososphaerota archaeon]